MDNLIKQLKEVYQPITVNGETLAEGNRDCQDRWNIIKPHISPHDVILEVGSATGYFTQRIAKEYPDSLVISIESDPIMCEIQRRTFEAEGLYNIVVCQCRLSPEDVIKWSKHVEIFDKVLLLSVLHHFPKDSIKDVFEAFKGLGDVIVEVPPIGETQACGQDTLPEIHQTLENEKGEWLGSTTSHFGHERDIIQYKRSGERVYLDAFFGVNHEDRHRFNVVSGKINGKNIISGVNAWNLLHFNVVWPLPQWWIKQARCAYESITGFKSDIRPWNLLFTSTGLKAIDFQATDTNNSPEDLQKTLDIFTVMEPSDWIKL